MMSPTNNSNRIARQNRWRGIATDRSGVAAVEFALVAGIVIVMLVAVFDLGLWVWQGMQLEGALLAGVHYAQEFPEDSSGINSVIAGSLPSALSNATVTVSAPVLDCGPGTTTTTEGGCSPVTAQRVFVTLSISRPFSPLYFTQITNTSLQYVIRVQ